MAKLYFRHGTMGSAKTLNLLAVAHSYQAQGKGVLILKPKLDTRFGAESVKSRSGLEKQADFLVERDTRIPAKSLKDIYCILVDEAQFLESDFVDYLQSLARDCDIPVICYGLRTDFKTHLFEGSKRLLELADAIEEIKSTCQYCNRKAVFNMRLIDGVATKEGAQVQLGAEESYLPVCSGCYATAFSGSLSKEDIKSLNPEA